MMLNIVIQYFKALIKRIKDSQMKTTEYNTQQKNSKEYLAEREAVKKTMAKKRVRKTCYKCGVSKT